MGDSSKQSIFSRISSAGKESFFVDGAFKRFLFPSLMSNLGLALGGMVDCLVVGSTLGSDGLSAISLGIPVYMFYNLLSYGFSIGGSIYYATLMGKGQPEKANWLFNNVLRFLILIYIATAALGLVFLPQLLQLLGANPAYPEVYAIADGYIRAQLLCIVVMFCQGPFYYFVLADGSPKRSAVALTISNAIDILLNYVFVIRLNMGAEGSVWSTAIGAMFCLIICGEHILRKHGMLRFCWAPFDFKELWQCFRTGFASAVQYVYQFAAILCTNTLLLSVGGPVGVAVFDVVYNLSVLAIAVADGIGMAIQPMISTYLAERDKPAVRRTINLSIVWGTMLATVVLLGLWIFARPLCAFFGLRDDAGTAGVLALRIYCISILPFIWNQIVTYYQQTVGNERKALVVQTLRLFVCYLAFAFPLAAIGLDAFWWIFPLSEVGALIYAVISIRMGKKTQTAVENERAFSAYIQEAELLGPTVEQLQRTCEDWDCTPQQGYYATLVVEEICAAILEDASRNKHNTVIIKLTVISCDEGFKLHLRDNSYAFNPFGSDDQPDGDGPNALGMSIVKKKAKEFFYRRYQGFNTLVVIL